MTKLRLKLGLLALLLAGSAVGLWWQFWGNESAAAGRALTRYPRIVLVTLDTLHVDFTGVINPMVETTPELDRLAAAGTVMVQAHTTVPITLPSHTSLLSGRTPLGFGVLRNGERIPAAVETLPQRLRQAGYHTGAFVSLATLRREFALDRGFEVYDDGHGGVPRFYRTADEVYDAAEAWLSTLGEAPWFLWAHLSDAHEPYAQIDAPPDVRVDLDGSEIGRFALVRKERHALTLRLTPGNHELTWTSLRPPRFDDLAETSLRLGFRDNTDLASLVVDWSALPSPDVGLEEPFVLRLRNAATADREVEVGFEGGVRKPPPSEVLDNYVAEVAFVDRTLGRLRQRVEAGGREVLWIVVSDHGEGLYRRGDILSHAGFGLEDQLRILWIMQGRGVPAGRRLETEPALIHDVAPTVLDLLGLPPLDEAEGVSLLPCWRDGASCPAPDRRWSAHGFTRPRESVSAVAAYNWPLKALEQEAVGSGTYDLSADPWELDDLSSTDDPELALEVRRLRRELQEISALLERRAATAGEELSDEELDMLKSLGYLGN